ncbi:MAG: pyrroline-5-carboxylate reductase [Proteobacteria bacterium]|nr:pyrroline-5-carboxylate reductase [Pseudomonadota bacterium]
MKLFEINGRGILLIGCGKMGSALLGGWLNQGLEADDITVIEPNPSKWLVSQKINLNKIIPEKPSIVIIAVKPQLMSKAVPNLKTLGNSDTLFISIAAGTSISYFEKTLGDKTPIIRVMPNTPAAIGKGITAVVGNKYANNHYMEQADLLLSAVGKTVRLESESQIDTVTAVSGSGPAYVFHLIEALAAAGVTNGLSPELSMVLAKATVVGAGYLAEASDESPENLRINVTSPGGTTQAALAILMDNKNGFFDLLERAVFAASQRSKELGALDND